MSLLKIEEVTKVYGARLRGNGIRANDGISLTVESGEVFGLLGPNGAGKSTLVNQIIGLVAPTSGKIIIAGVDVVANPNYARQVCAFQPQSQVPIEGVTPLQAIEIVGRLRGGRPEAVRQRARQLIDSLEIGDWAEQRGESLSGGVRRLTAFCMAAIVPGQLIILDEPTNDIDPLRRRLLWQEVRRLAENGTAVLLVTHNVLEAERAVDRLAVIDRGRVVAAGTPAALKEQEGEALRLELILEPAVAPPILPTFITQPVRVSHRLITRVEAGAVGQAVAWAQAQKEAQKVEEFSLGPATLEDVYLRLIGRPEAVDTTVAEVNHVISTAVA